MKTKAQEMVTRIYCDICGRQLTNENHQSLKDDTVHLCDKSPCEGRWKICHAENKDILIGALPSCEDMYYAGVRRIVMTKQ